MPFFLALVGAALGYWGFEPGEPWGGTVACAMLGMTLGLTIRARQEATKAATELAAARKEIEAVQWTLASVSHYAYGAATDLNWRLVPIERLAAAATMGPPATGAVAVAVPETVAATATAPAPAPETAPTPEAAPAPAPETAPAPEATPAPAPAPAPEAAPPPAPLPPPSPPAPPPLEIWIASARAWLLGGNTILRVGSIVLFLGLAFALRYAATAGYFPVELRYAAVGLGALALTGTGFAVRKRRREYGLILQGVGIGAMYLTVFAAMRLQPFVPLRAGLLLLIAIAVASAVLAVSQDAVGLATAAALGGFAAPVLASTGGGSHVALFSYLLLLDLAIVAIAWTKAWRSLNLIGFCGTFGIGTAWGVKLYASPLYETTQPFVILAFLVFVAVAVLFARRVLLQVPDEPESPARIDVLRWARRHSHAADATILFGTPIATYGLEYALVRERHLGPAFAALAMAAFYVALAGLFVSAKRWRYLVLVEAFVAIGVLFATLTLPLALDAQWTSAAWAIEGAALYWMSLRQRRPAARVFGLLLQVVSAFAYLTTLGPGSGHVMLSGAPLGAGMLGVAFLATYTGLYRASREECAAWEKALTSLLGPIALAFVYLVVALLLRSDLAAAVWAALGFGTLLVALRTRDRAWLGMALLVQLFAGAVFVIGLADSSPTPGSSAVIGTGWRGLLVAAAVSAGALASFTLAWKRRAEAELHVPGWMLAAVLLFALAFMNFGALFVLPWRVASGVWATTGLAVVWLSLVNGYRVGLWLGVASEVLGGTSFVGALVTASQAPAAQEGTPFTGPAFWTPAAISLAGMACAYRLHASERERPGEEASPPLLGGILIAWSAAFWSLAWLGEIERFAPPASRPAFALLVAATTTLVWALAARPLRWATLASFAALLSPVAVILLLVVWIRGEAPLAGWGAAAWPAAAVVHFYVLWRGAEPMPKRWPSALHVLGSWWLLGFLALESRSALGGLSGEHNAWRWLGWVAVPLAYLVVMASKLGARWWPLRDFDREYRQISAGPVAVVVVAWFLLGSVASDGTASPLPYVPLLNPLELGQLLSVAAVAAWFRRRVEGWRPAGSGLGPTAWQWGVGLQLLVFTTFAVARGIHHLRGVPFSEGPLLSSMELQAGLSLVWTLEALALMLMGNRSRRRPVWIAGAVLVALVVMKLFLVELSNRGGLERVISFIGVGVLLLIVGYFAPLPPAAPATPAGAEGGT